MENVSEFTEGWAHVIFVLITIFLSSQTGKSICNWLALARKNKESKALAFLQAGVVHVFRQVYAEIKEKNNGEITSADAKLLRQIAIKAAVQYSLDCLGVDVVHKAFPSDIVLDAKVEECVAKIKQVGNIPK